MREALLAAVKMTKRTIFLILWLVAVASIFVWTMVTYNAQAIPELKYEILLRHGLLMLVLALPSGWIASALVGAILGLVGVDVAGMADALLVSLTCAVAGYLQWFVLLPWLWSKWKARRADSPTSSV